MAKRTIHMLVDDIDGGEADETVRFAVDGVQYEIDLSTLDFRGLRGCEGPCLLDLTDFGVGGLGWANGQKTRSDDGAS